MPKTYDAADEYLERVRRCIKAVLAKHKGGVDASQL